MSNEGHQLPDPRSPKFWNPGRQPTTLIVRSPIDWWDSHWDDQLRKSRRCGGPSCALCAQGLPPILRFVLRVELPHGAHALLELRERHRPAIELMNADPHGQVGAVISVHKLGFGIRSKVEVEMIGRKSVTPISVANLVKSLGLEPALLAS